MINWGLDLKRQTFNQITSMSSVSKIGSQFKIQIFVYVNHYSSTLVQLLDSEEESLQGDDYENLEFGSEFIDVSRISNSNVSVPDI